MFGFVGLFSADGCLLFGFGFLICFRASVTRRFGFRVSGVGRFWLVLFGCDFAVGCGCVIELWCALFDFASGLYWCMVAGFGFPSVVIWWAWLFVVIVVVWFGDCWFRGCLDCALG